MLELDDPVIVQLEIHNFLKTFIFVQQEFIVNLKEDYAVTFLLFLYY